MLSGSVAVVDTSPINNSLVEDEVKMEEASPVEISESDLLKYQATDGALTKSMIEVMNGTTAGLS